MRFSLTKKIGLSLFAGIILASMFLAYTASAEAVWDDQASSTSNTNYFAGSAPYVPAPQCIDGLDNDGDGLVDAFDPGCMYGADNSELDPPKLPNEVSVSLAPQPVTPAKIPGSSLRDTDIIPLNIRFETDTTGNVFLVFETSAPAQDKVLWGLASQPDRADGKYEYEFTTPVSPLLTTLHRVTIGQIQSGRVYYFRAVSVRGNAEEVAPERRYQQVGVPAAMQASEENSGTFASISDGVAGFLLNPFVLLIVLGILIILVFFRRTKPFPQKEGGDLYGPIVI